MKCTKVKAYGATGSILSSLSEMEIERQSPKAHDVGIEVLFCGVCHSDLHQVQNDWHNTIYPCVPGHEVVGRVSEVGTSVSRFKVGDIVGVGCMVDSCGACPACQEGIENYCEGPVGWTATYNGYMKPNGSGFNTFGGYSSYLVVKDSFVLKIPAGLAPNAAAPILCAGVTTYSPLKHWGVKAGSKVGIVGLGGLGHMAVKLAKAMGAEVTVFTTTEAKAPDAREFGAEHVIISTKEESMKRNAATLDFILITIPEAFDVNDYTPLLKRDGQLVTVGLLGPYSKPLNNQETAFHRKSVGGSLIGSIAETQEVLDFCAKHGIAPDIKMIPIQEINQAFEQMNDKKVRYRYVIDMASLKADVQTSGVGQL